jgi:hypothetical protein
MTTHKLANLDTWDSAIGIELQELMHGDTELYKEVNRIFARYFHPDTTDEWRAVADEIAIAIFGCSFQTILDRVGYL